MVAIWANCLAHARRKFIEVTQGFPDEVRHVLTELGKVYKNDATTRAQKMKPKQRLRFHQEHSEPVMDDLEKWLRGQLDNKLVEPNSGLGQAIEYMLKRWDKFCRFCNVAGAPIDNNIAERALKKAILHRKNAYFYKTTNGAHVGDVFMSLIHTTELGHGNPFDYLTELLRHEAAVKASPADWLPWNYKATLAQQPGP